MNDEQLLRYSRHILLPEIDVAGQMRLLSARVLVLGLGGLGSPVSMYLAAAGIGELVLVDHDRVELSNLQRQISHHTTDIGRPKVESARDRIKALNPDCRVLAINKMLDTAELQDAVNNVDVVVDCTDNFESRYAVNRACVTAAKPLVSGAAIRFEAQLSTFTPGRDDSPCYACLYPAVGGEATETCTQSGVVAPLLGIVGSLQALETIKLLVPAGRILCGRLLTFDGLRLEWQTLRFRRDPQCEICGANRR